MKALVGEQGNRNNNCCYPNNRSSFHTVPQSGRLAESDFGTLIGESICSFKPLSRGGFGFVSRSAVSSWQNILAASPRFASSNLSP